MEIKKGKIKLSEIEKIYHGIKEIVGMNIDADVSMDLGLIHADYHLKITEFDKARRLATINVLEASGIKEDEIENISQLKQEKMQLQINEQLEKLRSKEYDVEYPIFTREELKSWVKRDKDKDTPTAFKPSLAFYANLGKYIVREEEVKK